MDRQAGFLGKNERGEGTRPEIEHNTVNASSNVHKASPRNPLDSFDNDISGGPFASSSNYSTTAHPNTTISPQTPPASELETLPTPLPSGDVYHDKGEHSRVTNIDMSASEEASRSATVNSGSVEIKELTEDEDIDDESEEEIGEDDEEYVDIDSSPTKRKSSQRRRSRGSHKVNDGSRPSSPTPSGGRNAVAPKPEPDSGNPLSGLGQSLPRSGPSVPQALPMNWRNPPPEPAGASEFVSLTEQDIETLPESSLRPTLQRATKTIQEYRAALRKYESLIAHYKLQNKLLTIETHEAAQRHEVETSIAKREVDRLRIETMAAAKAAQNAAAAKAAAPSSEIIDDLQSALESYKRRLRKTRTKLQIATDQLEDKDEEIERLRRGLSDMATSFSRESGPSVTVPTSGPPSHGPVVGPLPGMSSGPPINSPVSMAPGGPVYYANTPGPSQQPPIGPMSPSQNLRTPFTHLPPRQHQRDSSSASDDSGQGLSALEMLASQVLSQQRIPPSPLRRQPQQHENIQQQQLQQQQQQSQQPLLPLPTPSRQRSQGLMSPLEFNEASSVPSLHAVQAMSPEKRRRESSASTITIPTDGEDEGDEHDVNGTDEEVEDDDDDDYKESAGRDESTAVRRSGRLSREGKRRSGGSAQVFTTGAETDVEESDDSKDDSDIDNGRQGGMRSSRGTRSQRQNSRQRVPVSSESPNRRSSPGSPKKYIRKERNDTQSSSKPSASSSSSKRMPVGRILDFGN
ncbi:hypothetical protein AWJ20_4834 [Sugiyamaella lignohabitans]|uniref:Uncharacterized protein n=1 Tax=Sugiyamaella lignohabitans TaxID=796027 RepID=A0A167EBV0_9ASCO|nr:uncharacterized protein AWJ20_4834 [Sugiyamaella lignohabitans]ANB13883.1 hypothetical protein AWJ20_4834 [Sugiyamaella lignohabitans]